MRHLFFTKEIIVIVNELGTCYMCDEPAYVTVGWDEQTPDGVKQHVDKVCVEHLYTHPVMKAAEAVHET